MRFKQTIDKKGVVLYLSNVELETLHDQLLYKTHGFLLAQTCAAYYKMDEGDLCRIYDHVENVVQKARKALRDAEQAKRVKKGGHP